MKGDKIMEEKATKILVPTDGSENSERAIREAKKYGEYVNGEVTILTAVDPLVVKRYGYLDLSKLDNDALEDAAKSILAESLEMFDGFKGKVQTKLRRGNPADEILKEAEEGNYDLIIMGSRGLGVFSRTILGSVSNKVLNHTNKNVFIIK